MAIERARGPSEEELDLVRREAMAFAAIGLYRYTFDGVVLFMDRGAFDIFGLQNAFPDETSVVGKALTDLVVYLGPRGLMRKEIRRHKRIRAREWSFRTLAGEEKWVVEDSYLVDDQETRQEAIQVVVRDITEQRLAKEFLRERGEQYRRFLDSMTDPMHIVDANLRIVLFNEAFRNLAGDIGVNGNAIGRGVFEVFPFLSETVRDEYRHVLETGESLTTLERTTISEREFVTETRKIPAFERGRVTEILTIVRDMTDQINAENALRVSEEKYRAILDNIQEGYYEVDLRGDFTFFNKAMSRILGYDESEMLGLNYKTYYSDDARARVFETFNQVYSTRQPVELYDWEVVRKNGTKAVLSVSISLMNDAQCNPTGFRGIARDITRRREAEKALQEAEAQNRALLNAIPDAFVRLKRDGTVLDFKAGYGAGGALPSREEVVGRKLWNFVPRELADEFMSHVVQVLESASILPFDFRFMVDGELRDYEARLVVSGEDEALAIIRNISRRKRAERALRESEERYRELFENANDIVYTHDFTGRFTSLNKAGERISGYTREEALQRNAIEAMAPEYHAMARDMVQRKLGGESTTRYEMELIAKDGHRVPIEVSTRTIYEEGVPVGVQGIARDITERRRAEEERKRLEAQIQHAQKLEGLGVLAGGIAHDFNNLLVGMMGYAGLALTKLPPESAVRGYIEKIEASAQRAAELTNQMLAYSGRGAFLVRPINLFALAEDVARLISASISKKATLKFYGEPNLPAIVGDPSQVHQVIMNLVTNASDALDDSPGIISLRVTTLVADQTYLAKSYLDDALPEGRYVCLEVSDTGCGMDKETLARIFDPFFSTKFTGRGLGLAAVLGIVRGHKGAIRVYSEVGKGTTFKVLFPVGNEERTEEKVPRTVQFQLNSWKGQGAILIADDEEAARSVARDAFAEHGFEVLLASDGREAVELFAARPNDLKAVILDLTMPVMGGKEAFARMTEIKPEIPIILSSGYTEQDATTGFTGKMPAAFVQKPYTLSELLGKVHDVLERQ